VSFAQNIKANRTPLPGPRFSWVFGLWLLGPLIIRNDNLRISPQTCFSQAGSFCNFQSVPYRMLTSRATGRTGSRPHGLPRYAEGGILQADAKGGLGLQGQQKKSQEAFPECCWTSPHRERIVPGLKRGGAPGVLHLRHSPLAVNPTKLIHSPQVTSHRHGIPLVPWLRM